MKIDLTKVIPALIGTLLSFAILFEYVRAGSGCIGGYGKFNPYCGNSASVIVALLFIALNLYTMILALRFFKRKIS